MKIIKKNAQGYGYKYTDLAEITKMLGESGIDYYQYIKPIDGIDYIVTMIIDENGKKTEVPGCRVVEAKLSGKDNPVQAYGASLTYCRRYSLLMAFGLATTDDDAACLTSSDAEKLSDSEIKRVEALCSLKGVEPQTLFTGKSYKDMTPEEYVKLMKWLEGKKNVQGKTTTA